VLEHTLSEEEQNQILQTIEMFEVITQTQPDDYQSLEILKEAYQKVGRPEESLRISRKLAEAYFNAGSFTLAMQECELILQNQPNAPEILAMLGEIEARLQQSGQRPAESGASVGLTIAPNYVPSENSHGKGKGSGKGKNGSALVEPGGRESAHRTRDLHHLSDRGDDQLAKFLIVQQIFAEEEVNAALEHVRTFNKQLTSQTLALSLLEHLCNGNTEKLDAALSSLIDRTKFAYVPLEYYDIDRHVVRMLPDHLTLGRLFVPFDLISRTIMVAVCNPFDAAAREAVQQSLDYTVAWYIARPAAVGKILSDIYRLEQRV
jgi:tetratricopeptide (TPR) repeat protein